jgi:beta propeller repeat protein
MKWISRILIIVLMFVLISCLHVGISFAEEIPITTDPDDQYMPSIDGDRIVYTDLRNGTSDVYLYDLSTQTETRITDDPAHQGGPIISGDLIAYIDYRHGNSEIYLFDLSTMTEARITTYPSSKQGLDIHGRWIVWLDWRTSMECPPEPSFDILPITPTVFFYDLETSTEAQLHWATSYGGWAGPGGPSVYGDYAVWQNDEMVIEYVDCSGYPLVFDDPMPYIYISDLAGSNHMQIGSRTAFHPDIWEYRVIYSGMGDGNVYLYDLVTDEETPIISAGAYYPSIQGIGVVYLRSVYNMGEYEYYLYLYNILSGEEKQIVEDPVLNYPPAISGNKIVYTADRFGNWDIFLYELPGFHPLKGRSNEPLKLHCGATGEPRGSMAGAATVLISVFLIYLAFRRRYLFPES